MGNTNCATCSCGQDEELNQLSNLTFSVTKNKRKLEVNHLISAHIKEILFIQKEIKKFLLRKKEERDPFSKFNHKHSSSIVSKPKDEISSTNESILNNEIKYVEGLRINNAIYTLCNISSSTTPTSRINVILNPDVYIVKLYEGQDEFTPDTFEVDIDPIEIDVAPVYGASIDNIKITFRE